MFTDLLDGPARKRAYRVWAWSLIIISLIIAYVSVTLDDTPSWVSGLSVVVNLFGSMLGFTAADNTPNYGIRMSDVNK